MILAGNIRPGIQAEISLKIPQEIRFFAGMLSGIFTGGLRKVASGILLKILSDFSSEISLANSQEILLKVSPLEKFCRNSSSDYFISFFF